MPGPVRYSRRRLLGSAPAAVAGVTAAALPARADEPKLLSAEELKPVLDNLGYEPETLKTAEGVPFYRIRLKQDNWTFVLDLSLSKDRSNIWVAMHLATLPEPARVPVVSLLKLLKENDAAWPAYFSYSEVSKMCYLNVAIRNQDVTPAAIRKQVDALPPVVRRTQALWDPSQWGAAEEKKTATG